MGEDLCDTRLGLGIGGGSLGVDVKPAVRLQLWFPPAAKEVEVEVEEEEEEDNVAPMGSSDSEKPEKKKNKKKKGDGDDGGGQRKKLRLTRDQSYVLEDTFRAHNILSSPEKHELAANLGLRPRQVEVWFQNRRARTKLKQTEIDCEFLKKWCGSLSDENKRLTRQLHDLRFHAEVSKIEAIKICSSCQGLKEKK
ncbi:Homeobox-leucine zipper protein HOX17 [Apostasia shenzhenica]|uniref:Homeobox-leucine zipper protein HOX17 n=1 Tax=Apostasia shenzhenica TaxID=1088818 RepID=A0A2I0A761_9ASPA|nr:Homeobox-leucine zipper protein HOX17 [Apostasia shenzhenica]